MMQPKQANNPDRRELFSAIAALGVGTVTFQRALATSAAEPNPGNEAPRKITAEMVAAAEWVAGIRLTDAERQRVATALSGQLGASAAALKFNLDFTVAPAVHFLPGAASSVPDSERGKVQLPPRDQKKPATDDDLAFASIPTLAHLMRTKQVSSVELTKLSLARLRKFDPSLKCVVTFTEEIALKQAKAADQELAEGTIRGPLHGIPWGAKDLIAYPGYPTTWGAERFKNQKFETKAEVARRLDDAGAVLVAKLTLGALAWGDEWFGGMTRNPWNPQTGSSGSSAGSAAAVAAGCVPFAIGSETLGSILSPSKFCGVTGLRPTFGRVARTGCMPLSWSMDKLGPMARSVEDCAVVLGAIHGADGQDLAATTRPFEWPGKRKLNEITVGYFENNPVRGYDAAVKKVKELGVKLVPVALPRNVPLAVQRLILEVEAATAFEAITRAGTLDGIGTLWPGVFQQARFISAVDYLRANRLRTVLMAEMAKLMAGIDVYIGGNDVLITNLTGHPTISIPNGLEAIGGVNMPTALTFTGQLYGETDLLTVAQAYQDATGHHRKRPPLEKLRPS